VRLEMLSCNISAHEVTASPNRGFSVVSWDLHGSLEIKAALCTIESAPN